MSGDESDWLNYLAWNQALVEVLYPDLEEVVPVYLDLDDDVLKHVAEKVGFEGVPRNGLSDAVKRVTVDGTDFSLLRIVNANKEWLAKVKRSRLSNRVSRIDVEIPVPPSVCFLSLATMAALDMGNDDLISTAYYPRVGDLLGFPRKSDFHRTIEKQFHRYSERLWSELNSWIELFEGTKGLPSAYSLSKRYVGIPLSQALVRKADRQKLPIFFSQFNLSPGAEFGADTLSLFLEDWFNTETCSASDSLKKQWKNGSANDRIAEIVALELAGWDGALPKGHKSIGSSTSAVRLMATLNRGFMGEKFDLALTYRALGEQQMSGVLEIEATDGVWMPINFQPMAGNLWRTSNTHDLDISSVLEGAVSLRVLGGDEVCAQRRPRTVVPLIRDEIHGGYSEEMNLQLNVDSIVLVRNSKDSLEQVRKVFAEYARPGYEEKSFQELPREWVAFVGVQLFGVPPDSLTRFKELQPIAQNQLTVAGGVRIPASVRKWTVLAPPEVRVSVAGIKNFSVQITDTLTGGVLLNDVSDNGALVVELADLSLGTGDYRASVYIEGSKSPSLQSTIRLRSADEVDARWNLIEGLAYYLDEQENASGVISAVPEGSVASAAIVDGAYSDGSIDTQINSMHPLSSSWTEKAEENNVVTTKIKLAPVSADSCVYTGAHKMQIETIKDKRISNFQRGECLNCHLVKQFPMWPKQAKPISKLGASSRVISPIKVTELAKVKFENTHNWDAAIDALMHLGGGSGTILNSLAVQIDSDPIFTFGFANVLEQLGYVELQRLADGSVISWEISPTCLVEIGRDEWQLVGHWSPNMIEELRLGVEVKGGQLDWHPSDNQPTRVIVQGVGEQFLNAMPQGHVVTNAGSKMLGVLPRMSRLALALPRQNVMGFTKAEFFDVGNAAWEPTDLVERPGAFRLKREFRSLYIFRNDEDVKNQTAIMATPYLVKHLAANLEQRSLIHYDEGSKSLLVPIGVELPGLYARAIALMSGKLPDETKLQTRDGARKCRLYSNVARQDAQLLQSLLLG